MDVSELAYIDSTGYHFADYPAYLSWIQQKYRDNYGSDVYIEPDSQDGQFLAVLAKAFFDTAALGAAGYNSFSPATAQGVGLSRNVKINGLTRRAATHSTVDVLIVGVSGTIITGGIAIDTLNQKWLIPTTTIPGGGSVTATAVAELAGAVQAEANTVNRIFTPTRGWQTVNNVAAATAGVAVESDAQLRARQAVSTANPSLTVLDGMVGGVANLAGVTQVRAYENDTGSTDGNGIPAHSFSTMVLGGNAVAIAQEIALHKTPGTRTVGTTTETVYDSHGMPLDIKFTRPTIATISVKITLSSKVGWSTDYEALIAAAVAEVINAFKIGNDVLITRLYAPAYLVGTPAGLTFDIATIELKKNAGAFVSTNIDILYNEYPDCDPLTDFTFVVT